MTMRINAFASYSHYADHLIAIWNKLPSEMKGEFLVHPRVDGRHDLKIGRKFQEPGILMVAGSQDAKMARGPYIYVEHGAGQCLAPETRTLTSDLRWKPVSDLAIGEELIAFQEYGAEHPESRQPRQWEPSVVLGKQFLRLPCYELLFSDGTKITASAEHLWLRREKETMDWLKTTEIQDLATFPKHSTKLLKMFPVWEEDSSWSGGYLAAAFDGEGHLTQTGREGNRGLRGSLGFSQVQNAMLTFVQNELTTRGFRFSVAQRPGVNQDCFVVSILGGVRETVRFLGSIRPKRLLEKFRPPIGGGIRGDYVELVEKKYVGEQEVVGLETSSRTLIAEGIASHNSYNGGYRERVASYSDTHRPEMLAAIVSGPYCARQTSQANPDVPVIIAGAYRLSEIHNEPLDVVFTWHWRGGEVCPEADTGFNQFRHTMLDVAAHHPVVGHAHPRMMVNAAQWYRQNGLNWDSNQLEMLRRARVLVADNTSMIYEAAVLDIPCVILNPSMYRKDVNHGLRFWDLIPGEQVDNPDEVAMVVSSAWETPLKYSSERRRVAAAVYGPKPFERLDDAIDQLLDVLKAKL